MASNKTKNILKAFGLVTTAIGALLLLVGLIAHAFALFYAGLLLALLGFPIYLIGILEDKSN